MANEANIETDSKVESGVIANWWRVSSGPIGLARWSTYLWKPQPDITAYELALCLPIVARDWVAGITDLPDEAKRHFEQTED